MSSVAFAVSCARSFTSFATTAKPLPASPARAASIVAFNANRFVCSAIDVITFTTVEISADDTPSFATVSFVRDATSTAEPATRAASFAFCAISRIDAPISSAPVATVCTLRETCSAAADTTFALRTGLIRRRRDRLRHRRQLLRRPRQRPRRATRSSPPPRASTPPHGSRSRPSPRPRPASSPTPTASDHHRPPPPAPRSPRASGRVMRRATARPSRPPQRPRRRAGCATIVRRPSLVASAAAAHLAVDQLDRVPRPGQRRAAPPRRTAGRTARARWRRRPAGRRGSPAGSSRRGTRGRSRPRPSKSSSSCRAAGASCAYAGELAVEAGVQLGDLLLAPRLVGHRAGQVQQHPLAHAADGVARLGEVLHAAGPPRRGPPSPASFTEPTARRPVRPTAVAATQADREQGHDLRGQPAVGEPADEGTTGRRGRCRHGAALRRRSWVGADRAGGGQSSTVRGTSRASSRVPSSL